MLHWASLYAGWTAGTVMVVFIARRGEPLSQLGLKASALVVLANFVACNIAVTLFGNDQASLIYPAVDVASGAFFAMQWHGHRERSALPLLVLYLIELGRHLVFAVANDHSIDAVHAYATFLNVCYLFQLGCLVVPASAAILSRKALPRSDIP